jgi:hypothetical protein
MKVVAAITYLAIIGSVTSFPVPIDADKQLTGDNWTIPPRSESINADKQLTGDNWTIPPRSENINADKQLTGDNWTIPPHSR